jgi:stalled ribosome alternative rescue factor ArfA
MGVTQQNYRQVAVPFTKAGKRSWQRKRNDNWKIFADSNEKVDYPQRVVGIKPLPSIEARGD